MGDGEVTLGIAGAGGTGIGGAGSSSVEVGYGSRDVSPEAKRDRIDELTLQMVELPAGPWRPVGDSRSG